MSTPLQGLVAFAIYEATTSFNWTDPSTGQMKPLRSAKVLLPHGDGTVSRMSISLPVGIDIANLEKGRAYGFPCIAGYNRKKEQLTLTLRSDLKPFPAPSIE